MNIQPLPHCPIQIVYQDSALMVLNKPAGLLSVPGRGADKQNALSTHIQALYPDALVVHRLDQATSGLMAMARHIKVQRDLSRAFEKRQIHKEYVAIVHGTLQTHSGEINLPVMADWPRRPLQKVDHIHGKAALTRWRVLARDAAANTTRLLLEPITGRTHQLRVHLSAIGHPIVGDTLYGGVPAAAAGRMLLHAQAMQLAHPVSQAALHLHSSAPF